MGTMHVRGDPDEIREHYRKGPFRTRIEAWKDSKGCNVTVFADEWQQAAAKGRPERSYPDLLLCTECHARTGVLSLGPKDYYWRIKTRHGVLWAYNRQHLAEIRDFIQSQSRPQGFHKLPATMLKGSNREEMVRLINRAFERGPDTR
ncbi:MAG: hypothetical protein LAT64_13255 [Phycisphaerales bacterium]|nr:hypothetical protein [Planctomycetota bacterium]MCH8509722.1 hypothetical protein [Phycisphaerales bacterium]